MELFRRCPVCSGFGFLETEDAYLSALGAWLASTEDGEHWLIDAVSDRLNRTSGAEHRALVALSDALAAAPCGRFVDRTEAS